MFRPLFILVLLSVACSSAPPRDEEHHGEHHGPIHQHFDDAKAAAKRFDAPERNAWQKPEEVIALMRLEPGMRVADIGAGTGYFLAYLSEAVGPQGAVLGLDIEQGMVAYMTERIASEGLSNVSARKVSFDNPELDPGSVDRILVVNTWHHIPERAAYAARLHKALAPGGKLFIVDFTLESESGPPQHIRLTPEAAMTELESAFDCTLVEETLPRQYVIEAAPR